MGRRWRAWRPRGSGCGGEGGCGSRTRTGGAQHGQPTARAARCCSRGEGDVDMGRRWRAQAAPGGAGAAEAGPLGVVVAPQGAGAARVSS